MSLRDSFEAIPDRNLCKTCAWSATLEEDDQQYLRDKVADPRTDIRRLYRACKDNGLEAGETNFRKHATDCLSRRAGVA